MYTARRSVPAVVGLFAASFCSLPMFSQSTRFLSAEAQRFPSPGLSLSANPCSDNAHRDVDALPKEAWQTDSPFSSCNRPVRKASADLPAAPCNPSTQETTPCSASSDPVRDDLKARGKQGQVILRARDKVLEILQTENACTAWYRTKDPDPAATFRTVTYALDRDGNAFVRKTQESGGIALIHNPYVASVLQGQGWNATVTINVNGAFFFPAANMLDDHSEGGPLTVEGTRLIQVGPYAGGTFRAQVLALLHEFGHVIDLLPEDHDDHDGKSRQNTFAVLRACRAEVESKERPRTFLVSR